ncbi:MAG TPA: Flp pilus assembly protein CpaB [Phenylobacterium sp.]|nr:Flp pilus assembly protein CpaB [Phenylobacterium sp.]
MRPVRIVILVVAAVAAIGLALLVRGMMAPKPQPAATLASAPPAQPMARVLVAKRDLAIGTKLTSADMDWQDWPVEALNASFVTDGAPPKAKEDDKGLLKTAAKAATDLAEAPPAMASFEGALVREPIAAGEPMTARKVVRGGEGGYLSVMLAPGMRAVGVPVNSETGAGGFILPGDRVDVLQARRSEEADKGFVTQAVLTNVRVLAIDQATEPGKDSKAMVGAVATLEVPAADVENLARAKAQGDLTLVLRSYADLAGGRTPPRQVASGVRIIRAGKPSEVTVQ